MFKTSALIACLAVFAAIPMAGCSGIGPAGYNSDTRTSFPAFSGGVRSKELRPGIWEISSTGNGWNEDEEIQEMAALRAAHLALEEGKTHFAVLDYRDIGSAQINGRVPDDPGGYEYGPSQSDGSIPVNGYRAPSRGYDYKILGAKPGAKVSVALLNRSEAEAWVRNQEAQGRRPVVHNAEELYRTLSPRVRGNPPSLEEIYRGRARSVSQSERQVDANESVFEPTQGMLDAREAHRNARVRLARLVRDGATGTELEQARTNEDQTALLFTALVNRERRAHGLLVKTTEEIIRDGW